MSGLFENRTNFMQKNERKYGKILLVNLFLLTSVMLFFVNRLWTIIFVIFVVFNCILYSILNETTNVEETPDSLNSKEVKNGIKILKIAVTGMSMLSWLTTAGGLKEFVFREADWQAYIASFAIQAILIVLSLAYCQLYGWLKSATLFSKRFGKIIIYVITGLLTVSMLCSSSFSYVYIVEGIYSDCRAKDENIILEQFLMEQSTLLQSENEKWGESYKDNLLKAVTAVDTLLSEQQNVEVNEKASDVCEYIKKVNLTKYSQKIAEEDRFNEIKMEQIYAENRNQKRTEVEGVLLSFQSWYGTYDTCLEEYGKKYDLLNDFVTSEEDNSKLINAMKSIDWEMGENQLGAMSDKLVSLGSEVSVYEGYMYNKEISGYKAALVNVIGSLKQEVDTLKTVYTEVKKLMNSYEITTDNDVEHNKDLSKVVGIIIEKDVSKSDVDEVLTSIRDNVNLLKMNDEGEQELDTKSLNALSDLLTYFEKYKEYLELNEDLETFLKENLGTTYIINEQLDNVEDELNGIIYLTEEEWRNVRKKDLAEFIRLLKLLPEKESFTEGNVVLNDEIIREISDKVDDEMTDDTEVFDRNQVLERAYTLNRDLLENITSFEKAVNYFKYDFNMMAYFAAFLALFFDLGSFGAGCLFFALQSYKKKSNKANN